MIILVIADGIGDVSIKEFNEKTPLQHADTPYLDSLASRGLSGLMDPVRPGIACGSDTAHLQILGYPPQHFYAGRGPLESMGSGLFLAPGDIAFKANFATMSLDQKYVKLRRCDRDFQEWAFSMCEELNHEFADFPVNVTFRPATEHRCVVRVRGKGLSDRISGTDPLKDGLELLHCFPLDDSEAASKTCELVNLISDRVRCFLRSHRVNIRRKHAGQTYSDVILLRGAGLQRQLPSFQEHHGMKAFAIAPTAIISGLCASMGIQTISVENATGDYHTDLSAKSAQLIQLMEDDAFEFGFVHVKAVDEAGHDQDVNLKVHWLQKFDEMIGQILEAVDRLRLEGMDFVVAVTGDHSTLCKTGDHSCESVPVSVYSTLNEFSDQVNAFDEISVSHGALGRFPGSEFMPLLKNMHRDAL